MNDDQFSVIHERALRDADGATRRAGGPFGLHSAPGSSSLRYS